MNSSRILSAAIFLRRGAVFPIATSVSGSIENPSSVAILTALKIRRASSPKRSTGSPTALTTPAFKSFMPVDKSTIMALYKPFLLSLPIIFKAIAFIVKSRRLRSSSIFPLNITLSGRRLSEYFSSNR